MTLQYCIDCGRYTEHSGDFCTICGSNYTKADLLDIIDAQTSLIADLENALQNTEFILGSIEAFSYRSNQSVN